MASTNFVVTSLPDYVANNQDLLVKNFALVGGETRSRMTKQLGIKYKEHLNYLDIAPVLQDGKECGFNPSGTATLTQREIECPAIKVDMDFCEKHLLGKYAEYMVRVQAGQTTLPFEAEIIGAITDTIVKKIETLIWQGDKTKTTDANLKWFNGLLKIASTESEVIDVTIAGTSAYADIKAVYMALPEEALERGASIFVSPAIYRQFLAELVSANLFHYAGAVNEYPNEFILPGTDVKVVRTAGLSGSTSILGTFDANLVYGADLMDASESIDMWYSKDDRLWKCQVLWNCGVQIAFPNMVVLGTISE